MSKDSSRKLQPDLSPRDYKRLSNSAGLVFHFLLQKCIHELELEHPDLAGFDYDAAANKSDTSIISKTIRRGYILDENPLRHITDLVRSSIFCDHVAQIKKIGEYLKQSLDIVGEENKFKHPNERGHRCWELKVRLDFEKLQPHLDDAPHKIKRAFHEAQKILKKHPPEERGFICDCQIHSKKMRDANKTTHIIYEELRRYQSPVELTPLSLSLEDDLRTIAEQLQRIDLRRLKKSNVSDRKLRKREKLIEDFKKAKQKQEHAKACWKALEMDTTSRYQPLSEAQSQYRQDLLDRIQEIHAKAAAEAGLNELLDEKLKEDPRFVFKTDAGMPVSLGEATSSAFNDLTLSANNSNDKNSGTNSGRKDECPFPPALPFFARKS